METFFSSNNPSIVRKLLLSCQPTVIHTRIQAISSNYDSWTIRKRIIWNYSTWLCAFEYEKINAKMRYPPFENCDTFLYKSINSVKNIKRHHYEGSCWANAEQKESLIGRKECSVLYFTVYCKPTINKSLTTACLVLIKLKECDKDRKKEAKWSGVHK